MQKRREVEIIAGEIGMAAGVITRCSDPRLVIQGFGAAGSVTIIFPPDFQLISCVANPTVANFSCGVTVPSPTANMPNNSCRVNTQTPPNVTNADTTIQFIAAGYSV